MSCQNYDLLFPTTRLCCGKADGLAGEDFGLLFSVIANILSFLLLSSSELVLTLHGMLCFFLLPQIITNQIYYIRCVLAFPTSSSHPRVGHVIVP